MSINWGFIGAGMVAEKALAPAVRAAGNANLYAVASRDIKRAQALKPEVAYDNYEELLNDPKVDAVYISLPNNLHKELSIKALNAGKNVLCEKPLAMNYAQVQEMFAAAKSNNRLLVEAIWFRWHLRSNKMMEVVALGEIGEPLTLDATFTFENKTVNNYRFDPLQGGGALLDLAPYPLHLLVALTGASSAISSLVVQQKIGASGVDLTTTVKGVSDKGLAFNFHLSFEQTPKQEISITGSKGELNFGASDAFTNWNTPSSLIVNNTTHNFAALDPYQLMVESVSDSITGVNRWLPSEAESLFVMGALDQIRSASRSE